MMCGSGVEVAAGVARALATLLLLQACWCATTTRTTKRAASSTTTAAPPPPPLCSDAGRSNTSSAVRLLREAMRQPRAVHDTALDAFIVVSTDEHQNEEPSKEDRRLEYVSGWWGEGLAVVLHTLPEIPRLPGYQGSMEPAATGSALWVPAGLYVQARRVVGCSWDVFDRDDLNSQTLAYWLSNRLAKDARVGADPRLIEYLVWEDLTMQLAKYRLKLVHVPVLLDSVWEAHGRPPPGKVITFVHDIQYTGRSWLSKVTELRMELRSLGADAMVVTALDEIAWLLNIRGKDLPYSPLVKSFLIVTSNELRLFIPQGKLNVDSRNSLGSNSCYSANCTHVEEYDKFYLSLRTKSQAWNVVLIPKASNFHRGASEAVVQSVPEVKRFLFVSPIIYMKARKNPVEIKGMVKAQIADGIAMCQLLEYFERTFRQKKKTWDELSLRDETDHMRLGQPENMGIARRTVVGFCANSAAPDYRVTNATNTRIYNNCTVLLGSGGQYRDGTAVVTRTLHLGGAGAVSPEQRAAYTRVLQATIALTSLTWPAALPAAHVDVVARAELWQRRRDYPHATGHGVGAFLNQREDPIQIDHNLVMNLDTFKEGYFVTVEPAWYEPGKFGIRLGNVLQVVAAEESGAGKRAADPLEPPRYLTFLPATLVPYEPNLIHVPSLTEHEKQWLNAYYKRVRTVLKPEFEMQGMLEARDWMMQKTMPIEETQAKPQDKSSSAAHACLVSLPLLSLAFPLFVCALL